MASENSEMQITENRLNEETISLCQGLFNESSDSHAQSCTRRECNFYVDTLFGTKEIGKLPADCRTPIPVSYYSGYVPDVRIPLSSPLTPSPRRKLLTRRFQYWGDRFNWWSLIIPMVLYSSVRVLLLRTLTHTLAVKVTVNRGAVKRFITSYKNLPLCLSQFV